MHTPDPWTPPAQVRVCVLLTAQLQNLLDPVCKPALQALSLRVVLRVVRTVLRSFYRQLRSKPGVFVETLLAGAPRTGFRAHANPSAHRAPLLLPPAALQVRHVFVETLLAGPPHSEGLGLQLTAMSWRRCLPRAHLCGLRQQKTHLSVTACV